MYNEYVKGNIIFVVWDIWYKFISLLCLIVGEAGVKVFPKKFWNEGFKGKWRWETLTPLEI